MLTLSLNGSWRLQDATESDPPQPATVPGCVHTDLLESGKIPDPWYRDNEKEIQWVHHRDWVYEKTFEVDPMFLSQEQVLLVFEGLDTFCKVELNDRNILEADNMHRTWEIPVKECLQPGQNRLRLTFASPVSYMKEKNREHHLHAWNTFHEDFSGKSYVRKMACAFGWDWGLMAPTVGIWRPVKLIACDARIKEVKLTQRHEGGGVVLHCHTRVQGNKTVRHRLLLKENQVAEVETETDTATLQVENPQLWWPNGMGEQPLYQLVTELLNKQGGVLDKRCRRIGLRSCELVRDPDEYGESFRFRINGRDVFMKGGNWIPCDIFPSRITDKTYRHLLESSAAAHMNMIRVWGGGIYEKDRFYDLCDELGILVWQDFMFACSTYPSFDDAFMENVRAEARDNVRRLRDHPCLALWCGNNELEQGLVQWDLGEWTDRAMPAQDYRALFDELLPKVVAEEDPATPYWPSSGHTPGEGRGNCWDDTKGDAHAWTVWFGGQPLEAQRDWKFRFMSEFGFQSFPELKTVESYTAPEDRNLVNWIMDYHQRSGPGNQTILKYALDWFNQANGFASSLIVSQLIQALTIQYASEHARRIQGRMDGLLYWQINDLWPGATWSSIDAHGRWKALHYFARRFFAPVMVSLLENHHTGHVAVHVSNHRAEDFSGTVQWFITNAAGSVIDQGTMGARIPSQSNREITTLACQKHRANGGTHRMPLQINQQEAIPMEGDRDLLVWAVLEDGQGRELSRNLAFFAKPKYWKLRQPRIDKSITEKNGRTVIELRTDHAAPWTRLACKHNEVVFSDNYLHLVPGRPTTVSIARAPSLNPADLKDQLQIIPFLDLFA